MRPKKYLILACLTMAFTVAAFVVAAEITLRFLPVNEGLRNQPVNAERPIAAYEPVENLLWSRDWNFSLVNSLRVNRQGFVNQYDYDAGAEMPVLAVVGDSMIQASMVPFEQTLHGRLEQDARTHWGGNHRVFSFAASGAPLSQYLAYARHAQDNHRVEALIVAIIANDFDESLPRYRDERRFHQFHLNAGGEYELGPPRGYTTNPIVRLGRHSALFRYLYLNVELRRVWARLRTMAAPEVEYVANTSADLSDERVGASKDVVDTFLRLLPEYAGLPPSEIAFVVDSPRRELYALSSLDELEQSYFSVIREYFMGQARAKGYEVIDMAPHFFEKHKRSGVVFEYPTDGHWNPVGHETVYEAITASEMYRRFIALITPDES